MNLSSLLFDLNEYFINSIYSGILTDLNCFWYIRWRGQARINQNFKEK